MSAARRHIVKRLLQSALERPPDERERFLDEECAGDEALRREVQSRLAEPETSEPRTLERAAVLGSYEIISLIGAGGMGEVYRARDTRIQREVAIKRLPRTFSHDPDRLSRFEREARLAGSLNHPSLVTIHDVGTHDGAPFVVMELLRGTTLREKLRRGTALPVGTAVHYALQIASGLAAAHEQAIVHRDLKPENVFITEDERVKILDFGLAKNVPSVKGDQETISRESGHPTRQGVILGTVPYMSPEQVNGEPVDPRSDIFSFGVILHEMLSGRDPFKRDSAIETMHAIVAEDPADLAGVPPLLNGIVRRCLQKKRGERFQSARDVGYALELVRAGGDEVGRGVPQRKRWRTGLTAVAAAVVIAAAAIGFLAARDPRPVSYERITFRRGLVTQARFAPDGQTVIYSAAWDGGPLRLFMRRPDSIDSVAMDLPPADLLSISRSGELAILLDPRLHVPFGTTIGTLARVPMNGGAPRRMIENVLSADWSPDERSIVVARDTGVDQRLEIRSADGAQLSRELLVTSSGSLGHVRFSPAGDRIAFTINPNRAVAVRLDVAVINADGTGQRLVGRGLNFSNIVWSPDGREIWFAEGIVAQAAVRAASMSGGLRTVFETPGNTSFSDVAGGKVLLTQNELAARVSCLARGADAERDASWRTWSAPFDLTDGGQLLLHSGMASTKGAIAVGLQPLDGSPIIELARDAFPYSFSADERSVLVGRGFPPRELAFVPVGSGETHVLPPTGFDMIAGAAAAPNGKTVVLAGVTNNTARLYELPLAGGPPRKISDDPLYFPWVVVAPDSALVAAIGPTRRLMVYRIDDGKATVIESSIPGDFPIRFADDGSLLFIRATGTLPNPLYRFDFGTQRETLIREFAPGDRAGVLWACPNVRSVTADGQSYCYQYAQVLSKLMVVEGLDLSSGGRLPRVGRSN